MRSKQTSLHLTELLIAVAVVVGALIWAERAALRQISAVRNDITINRIADFHSADQLRAAILELHAGWRRLIDGSNLINRTQTEAEEHKVRELLAAHLSHARLSTERESVAEINAAFEDYFHSLTNSFAPENRASPAANHSVEIGLERLLALTEKLALADQSAAEHFVIDAHATLSRSQRFHFIFLVTLLVGGIGIAVIAYWRTIVPVRSTLVESRAMIDRQEKLASLGVFATGIAHEIRNPLTAIKVRLFSLKASHRPATSEHEDLEVIGSEIDRLERIVRDFIQFARPSPPNLQIMSGAKLLQEIHDLLASGLSSKSIQLKLDIAADEQVNVDPHRMKQVLINFVQNAADSIENGGTIRLRLRADRQLLNERMAPIVVLDVADTGKGMPPEVQKRLFDPFFTTKEAGTGLGLPIAARIVERHGGIIRYETQPNRGTTFSIVLPRAVKDEK
jgi:signal transduction histidine kinase